MTHLAGHLQVEAKARVVGDVGEESFGKGLNVVVSAR
jgi:hypothetical protein